jgi:hypothetical protein
MSLFRKLAIGAVLAFGALAASNASAGTPNIVLKPGLHKPHIKLCIPHTYTRVVRIGFHRYLITYHMNRFCRVSVVRVIRLPFYAPHHRHHS